jgi:glycosyltransferase involved in cell wall biosynthesis
MTSGRQRIAMVTDAIYPYHRGGKEFRYYQLSHLLSRDADVDMYTMNWWNGAKERADRDVTLIALCRLRPLYLGGKRSFAQAIWFAFSCLRLFVRPFDVIEADHMPYLQLFTLRLVSTIRRKRLVVTWHEVWGMAYWRTYAGRAGIAAGLIERCSMHLPHEIIAASPETAARLHAALGSRTRITVAPNGVDVAEIDAVSPSPLRSDIISVGRLIQHKRLDLLLHALVELRQSGCVPSVTIIGNGPEEAAIRRQISELALQDQVQLRTDVSTQRELYGLMKASRVFAAPSEREGFGVAVLEAIACGIPVVTTDAPDNLSQDLVRESNCGSVVPPTVASFASALGTLLTGPRAERRDRSPEVERWLSDYDWSATAQTLAGSLNR